MFRDSLKCLLIVTSINVTFTMHVQAQENNHKVHVIGEMRKVMWEGKLEDVINLDTIGTKENLYGLGPVEFLTGEVVIIDGTTYVSTVVSDSTMNVEESYEIEVPFFAYDTIKAWKNHTLPDSIRTIKQLEGYLDVLTR